MSELTLCMIVRDEAEQLERLLPEIATTVDEVVIVDTGSTDQSEQVAAEFVDRWIEQPWQDDFSHARNRALEEASGDWILVLDADESIDADDRDRIASLLENAADDIYGFIFDVRNYTDDCDRYDWRPLDEAEAKKRGARGYLPAQVVRLFRNNPDLRYQGRIHELIEHSIFAVDGRIVDAGISLHHPLTERNDARGASKRERYHRLLELKVADEPTSAKAHWELAQSQLTRSQPDGDTQDARTTLERAWQLAPGNLEIGLSLAGLLNTLQQSAAALPILEEVRDHGNPDPRVEFQLGLAQYGVGHLESARESFYSAHLRGARFPQALYWLALLTSEDVTVALGFVAQLNRTAPEFWPGQILAAHLHVRQDDAASALESLYGALSYGDGSNRYLHELGDFLRLLNTNEAGRKVWAEIESEPELCRLAAAALDRAGDSARAAELRGEPTDPLEAIRIQIDSGQLEEAVSELGPWLETEECGAEAHYLLARVAIAETRWAEAGAALTTCLEKDGTHVRALTDLAGLHGNSGRLNLARKLLERAVEIAPQDGLIHHNLAVAATLANPPDLASAKFHMERARTLGHREDPELTDRMDALTPA